MIVYIHVCSAVVLRASCVLFHLVPNPSIQELPRTEPFVRAVAARYAQREDVEATCCRHPPMEAMSAKKKRQDYIYYYYPFGFKKKG